MPSSKGRSIELFFVNGDPDGIVTAAIPFQWTGNVLVARRTQLDEALSREEVDRPGAYLLIGEIDGRPSLYVGETDVIKDRIKSHVREKDWWDQTVLITSNGEPLNKAHVRYLENRLFEEARRIGKIAVDYGRSPSASQLSEAARAHMDDFMDNLMLVLPALGFHFYTEDVREPERNASDGSGEPIVRFVCTIQSQGISASAILSEGRFIVEKGSKARKNWIGKGTENSTYAKLHSELVGQGILAMDGSHRVFAKDYAFKSTSAAAAVVSGRNASGPASWTLVGSSKTYSDWEAERL
ncbi:GIY-YIG nuclease family protein [uncultured Erythrobacter sp.]|uniref:GIY-YIG nuclease family protein n=1 Tax=uncultured Erythrobacter sp. TaxID=263913 RepID=UPI0026255CA4|nr:GIY-YIG nuclease family protein [uncultured Erythrobacter sp.]